VRICHRRVTLQNGERFIYAQARRQRHALQVRDKLRPAHDRTPDSSPGGPSLADP